MTRDEIVQIAWDVGVFIHSHPSQDGPTKLEQFAERIAAAEREKIAAWMHGRGYATGHGDTVEDLLKEMEWQVAERERIACVIACDKIAQSLFFHDNVNEGHTAQDCAAAISARGEQEQPR